MITAEKAAAKNYMSAELDKIAGGAALKKFRHGLSQVLENIHDEDTPAQKKRTVTLKIEITPNKERDRATAAIICDVKVPAKHADETTILLGKDANGKGKAFTLTPAQWDLFSSEEDEGESDNVVSMPESKDA